MDSVCDTVAVPVLLVISLPFHDVLWEVFLCPDSYFEVSLKISVLSNVYTSHAYGNTVDVNQAPSGSCRLFTVARCGALFGWDSGAKLCSFCGVSCICLLSLCSRYMF